ncbi:hypothetical protein B0J11DRAFT_511146 [Dendryphion nanum]|uniref:F-box domain-containing protein n=1 Tax=Dendryphion nanum TaxID=256645 RepID=A0A9P9D8S7_9PLEO|nr:hypothetical protein B0J11DRAFT_511146 [Dendryphion nanum]
MTSFTKLPVELMVQVLCDLETIDDVHNLGLACEEVNNIITTNVLFTKIMRVIIQRSPYHRYDVQLCRLLDLHEFIVQHFQDGKESFIPQQPHPDGLKALDHDSLEYKLLSSVKVEDYEQELTAERVHQIVKRWVYLRPLQGLWLQKQLGNGDYLSFESTREPESFMKAYLQLQKSNDLTISEDRRSGTSQNTLDYTGLNANQTGRFYAAATAVWVMNEIRWALTNFAFPTNDFQVPLEVLDLCKRSVQLQAHNPLLDLMDQYAVYRFLYHHLLPLHSPILANQDSVELPFTFSDDYENSADSAQFLPVFLLASQTYLHPPDIAELVFRNKTGQQYPNPLLGPSTWTGAYLRPSPDYKFPANYPLNLGHPLPPNTNAVGSSRLLTNCMRTVEAIQHATYTQSSQHPANLAAILLPVNGMLMKIDDLLSNWFQQRIHEEFGLNSRPSSTTLFNIQDVFDDKWNKDVQWQIWGWADSDDNARALMELWRELPAEETEPPRDDSKS